MKNPLGHRAELNITIQNQRQEIKKLNSRIEELHQIIQRLSKCKDLKSGK